MSMADDYPVVAGQDGIKLKTEKILELQRKIDLMETNVEQIAALLGRNPSIADLEAAIERKLRLRSA